MNNQTWEDKKTTISIIMLLVFIGGAWFLSQYWRECTTEIQKENRQTREYLAVEKGRYQESANLLHNLFGGGDILTDLSVKAEKYELTVLSLAEEGEEEYRNLRTVAVYMTIRGDYFAIVKWLADVEGGVPWTNVEIIEMTEDSQGICSLETRLHICSL